jgi:hypothetical protein
MSAITQFQQTPINCSRFNPKAFYNDYHSPELYHVNVCVHDAVGWIIWWFDRSRSITLHYIERDGTDGAQSNKRERNSRNIIRFSHCWRKLNACSGRLRAAPFWRSIIVTKRQHQIKTSKNNKLLHVFQYNMMCECGCVCLCGCEADFLHE